MLGLAFAEQLKQAWHNVKGTAYAVIAWSYTVATDVGHSINSCVSTGAPVGCRTYASNFRMPETCGTTPPSDGEIPFSWTKGQRIAIHVGFHGPNDWLAGSEIATFPDK